jgi:hypothetical protein
VKRPTSDLSANGVSHKEQNRRISLEEKWDVLIPRQKIRESVKSAKKVRELNI